MTLKSAVSQTLQVKVDIVAALAATCQKRQKSVEEIQAAVEDAQAAVASPEAKVRAPRHSIIPFNDGSNDGMYSVMMA